MRQGYVYYLFLLQDIFKNLLAGLKEAEWSTNFQLYLPLIFTCDF